MAKKTEITKGAMAKVLSKSIDAETIAKLLARQPRIYLVRLMALQGISLTENVCEGCGCIVKSWYDHEETCPGK